ncbi:MAG TPA: sodium:solute symporter family protein [Bacteroidota bacterium]|nr:sodium:solute symporter family protein [Bacteroidota bacterium]
MVHLSPADIILILAYFGAVVYVGYRATRRSRSGADEYLLASRTLTLPMFVATLVSTWYGGILGVGEFSYRYGISNWIVFGVPYYIFALIFALFLAKKVRATNLYTIPDKLEQSFDRKTAVAGGFLTFFLVSPAPYVLMLGVLFQLVFGLSLLTSMVLTTFLTVCYLYAGGFRSDIWVNAFEFVMMFLGFALVVVFAYAKFGGINFIRANVPSLHLSWNGGNNWQFILVWFFIALWTLVDPAFHQRCSAAKDSATAQRGILWSIPFWFFFDFMTSTAGLYARATLPSLENPTYSYPMLAEVALPSIAKGIFYIGMLATIMSTLSSLTLISAITVGKDIVGRIRNASHESALVQRWTRIGLILTALVAIAMAAAAPSVVALWYTIGTCIIPGLLVPVLASYFDRLRVGANAAFAAMIAGWGLSTASFIHGHIAAVGGMPSYWFGLEPMYPGLVASMVVWGFGKIRTLTHRNIDSSEH